MEQTSQAHEISLNSPHYHTLHTIVMVDVFGKGLGLSPESSNISVFHLTHSSPEESRKCPLLTLSNSDRRPRITGETGHGWGADENVKGPYERLQLYFAWLFSVGLKNVKDVGPLLCYQQ